MNYDDKNDSKFKDSKNILTYMELSINTYKLGERPEVKMPNPEILNLLKEEGMRKLVGDHYDLMRESSIRNLFPTDDAAFETVKQHSADFFIQICGGPAYFNQNRGKPMLISRHTPFKITYEARLTWLDCYRIALLRLEIPEEYILSFWNYINVFSIWMVNSVEPTIAPPNQ